MKIRKILFCLSATLLLAGCTTDNPQPEKKYERLKSFSIVSDPVGFVGETHDFTYLDNGDVIDNFTQTEEELTVNGTHSLFKVDGEENTYNGVVEYEEGYEFLNYAGQYKYSKTGHILKEVICDEEGLGPTLEINGKNYKASVVNENEYDSTDTLLVKYLEREYLDAETLKTTNLKKCSYFFNDSSFEYDSLNVYHMEPNVIFTKGQLNINAYDYELDDDGYPLSGTYTYSSNEDHTKYYDMVDYPDLSKDGWSEPRVSEIVCKKSENSEGHDFIEFFQYKTDKYELLSDCYELYTSDDGKTKVINLLSLENADSFTFTTKSDIEVIPFSNLVIDDYNSTCIKYNYDDKNKLSSFQVSTDREFDSIYLEFNYTYTDMGNISKIEITQYDGDDVYAVTLNATYELVDIEPTVNFYNLNDYLRDIIYG